jgi:hypothetical protein
MEHGAQVIKSSPEMLMTPYKPVGFRLVPLLAAFLVRAEKDGDPYGKDRGGSCGPVGVMA